MSTLNPIALINQILGDYASPKVRRLIHSLILLVAFVVTLWQASDGDWKKALGAGLLALYGAANQANTIPGLHNAGHDDPEDEDDLTYEQAGGNPFPETDGLLPGATGPLGG